MPRPTAPQRYIFSKNPPTYAGGFAVIISGILAWVFLPGYSPQSWDLIWTVWMKYTPFLWSTVWLACFGHSMDLLGRRWSSESVRQFRAHWLLYLILAVIVFEMEVWSDGRILEKLLWPVEKLLFWHYPLYWQPSCWSDRSLVCNVIFKPLRSAGIQWGALLAIYFYVWPQVQKLISPRMWFLLSWTASWILLERLTDLRPLPWSSELKEVLEYDGFGAEFSIIRIGKAAFDLWRAWTPWIFIAGFVIFYITEFAASIYGDPRRDPHINWDGYESSASAIGHRFRENLWFRDQQARGRYSPRKGNSDREVSDHLSDGPPGRDFYSGSEYSDAHSTPSRRVKTSFQGYEYTSESEATIAPRRRSNISSRGYPRTPSRIDETFYDKGWSSEENTPEYTTEEEDLTESSISYSQPVFVNKSSPNNTSQSRWAQQPATPIHPTFTARNTPQKQAAQSTRDGFRKSIGSAAVNGQPKISPQRFSITSDTAISIEDGETEEEDNRTERADSPKPIYVGHRINSPLMSQIWSPKQSPQATASPARSTKRAAPPSPPTTRVSSSLSPLSRGSPSGSPSLRISPQPTPSPGPPRRSVHSPQDPVARQSNTPPAPSPASRDRATMPPLPTRPRSGTADRAAMPPPPPPPGPKPAADTPRPRGRMPSRAGAQGGARTSSTKSRIPRSASRASDSSSSQAASTSTTTSTSISGTPTKKTAATPNPPATPRTPRTPARASSRVSSTSPPASRTRSAMKKREIEGRELGNAK
jgi:hypothetical protein